MSEPTTHGLIFDIPEPKQGKFNHLQLSNYFNLIIH
jgi:hypothetical protein